MGKALEKSYDEIAGGRNMLDVAAITADADALVEAAVDVEKVRHTVYAHRSAAGPALDTIGLETIHRLVDLLDELVNKYRGVLLYEPYMDGHTPQDQTNWVEILTFPWIERERNTSVPHAASPDVITKLFDALRPNERAALLLELQRRLYG